MRPRTRFALAALISLGVVAALLYMRSSDDAEPAAGPKAAASARAADQNDDRTQPPAGDPEPRPSAPTSSDRPNRANDSTTPGPTVGTNGSSDTPDWSRRKSALPWPSMPALPAATGAVQPGAFKAEFELVSDSCGTMPASSKRDFEIGVVGDSLVVQFDNASWQCDLTEDGTFDCPIAQEGQLGSAGREQFLERRARGSYRSDGSFSFQVQSQSWCEGASCEQPACVWAFAGTAVLATTPEQPPH